MSGNVIHYILFGAKIDYNHLDPEIRRQLDEKSRPEVGEVGPIIDKLNGKYAFVGYVVAAHSDGFEPIVVEQIRNKFSIYTKVGEYLVSLGIPAYFLTTWVFTHYS